MNRTVTITSKNHKYQNTYGGDICISDFCTDYEGSRNIADRIISDWKDDLSRHKQMENNIRSFRAKKRELADEQKKQAAERMRKY